MGVLPPGGKKRMKVASSLIIANLFKVNSQFYAAYEQQNGASWSYVLTKDKIFWVICNDSLYAVTIQ